MEPNTLHSTIRCDCFLGLEFELAGINTKSTNVDDELRYEMLKTAPKISSYSILLTSISPSRLWAKTWLFWTQEVRKALTSGRAALSLFLSVLLLPVLSFEDYDDYKILADHTG
jgi:hypothetical protein